MKTAAEHTDGTRTTADGREPVFIVNVSGRGDKDVDTAATWFNMRPADSEENAR